MRSMHLLVSFLFFSASLTAAPWARVAGGVYAESLVDLVVSPKGHRIAVGSTASIAGAGSEGWLLAHDANGKLLWQKALGVDGAEFLNDITPTSDGGYILVGRTQSGNEIPNLWIVKLDAKYKLQWWRLIGGADWDDGYEVIQTADGGYLIAGLTRSFGRGETDGWLVRLDANGEILWQKAYGGEGWEHFGDVLERPDGTLLASGSTTSFGSGGRDMWLLSLNASGGVLWARTYGGTSDEMCFGMLVDPDGFIMLCGYFGYPEYHAADAWILRLRSNGAMSWKKRYGGEADFDSFADIVRMSNGNYVVAGTTSSYGNGSVDGWVMEIDRSGRAVWQRTYGGEGDDYLYGLVATAENEYMAFGSTSSYGAGGQDGWLVGVDANGVPPAGCTELSRTINSPPKGVPASSRSIAVSVTASSAAILSKSMHIKKASLPASDLCGTSARDGKTPDRP